MGNTNTSNPPSSPPRLPKRQKAELTQASIKKEAAAKEEDKLEERFEQDRLLQKQIHAEAKNDSGALVIAAVGCTGMGDAADSIEVCLNSYKNAAQVKLEKAYTNKVFFPPGDEEI